MNIVKNVVTEDGKTYYQDPTNAGNCLKCCFYKVEEKEMSACSVWMNDAFNCTFGSFEENVSEELLSNGGGEDEKPN